MSERTPRIGSSSRKAGARRAPIGPLGRLAVSVRTLAEQLRDQHTTSRFLAALQQRQSELAAVERRTEVLAAAARLLRSADLVIPTLPSLRNAKQAVSELAEHYHSDPNQAVNGSLRVLEAPLKQMDELLQKAWQELASAPVGAPALSELLAKFPQFALTAARLHALCIQLAEWARALPRSAEDLARVNEARQALQSQIDALETTGFDSKVQEFLRRSATGVSLAWLLNEPQVIEFLKDHKLMSSLVVSLSSRTNR